MVEYGPVPESDRQDRDRITWYSFNAAAGVHDPDAPVDDRVERYFGVGDPRGVFDDGHLVATCDHIELEARVRGHWLPVAGMTLVATPPEYRRQGYVAELLAGQLREYREKGWVLSALAPFDESFYARYGWATGMNRYHASVEPSALAPAAAMVPEDGRFRRVTPEEAGTLSPVYRRWLEGTSLATRRSEDWWRDRTFQTYDRQLFGYLLERDGEPTGYLIYDIRDGDDGGRLVIDEMAYVDQAAYCQLLGFCFDHESQVEVVELVGPRQDQLLDVVTDREALDVRVEPRQMVRLVDVPHALEAIEYPGVEAAEVVLEVRDDHAPWNDGTFAVTIRDGEAAVAPVDQGAADAPGATVDIGTLSQLFVGYRSVETARALGELSAEGAAVDLLSRLFPPEEVYLPESF